MENHPRHDHEEGYEGHKRATRATWEAHTKSRTVAKSCHKELAELYEERLRANGLTVFIEPTR